MRLYIILFLLSVGTLLPGCTFLTGDEVRAIATQVDQLDQSVRIVGKTVNDLAAASSDPNKYDEVVEVAKNLAKLSNEFNRYVAEVNAVDMDPVEVLVTGTDIASKVVTPINLQMGITLAALAGLAGVWLKKDKKV